MQSLEPKIAGGCTAVLAVICNGHLFVANVGDSRVLLIRESEETGALSAEQLSQDHTIESESELARLEALGLPRAQLLRAGRLGTQENTRSIGDYYIKEGYKNVDSLRFVCIYRYMFIYVRSLVEEMVFVEPLTVCV